MRGLLVSILAVWISGIAANVRPGFRARVTTSAMEYGANVAVDLLMREMEGLQIPDINAAAAGSTVSINNMRIVNFPRPTATMFPIVDYGLAWVTTNVALTINADFVLRIKPVFFTITKTGTLEAQANHLSFSLEFMIGRDNEGRPMLYDVQCLAEGNDIDIDFRGDLSSIFNFVFDALRSKIKSAIKAQLCAQAKNEISNIFASEIATMPVAATILDDFVLDYRMVQFPTFTDDYMETSHKGAIYLSGQQEEPLLEAPVIPEHPEQTTRMAYLYITDYLINTGLLAAFNSGLLAYNITQDIIPADARQYLRTTCPTSICIGTIFSQLPVMFPDATAGVDILTTEAPSCSVDGNEISAFASGEARFYVSSDGSRVPLFTVSLNVTGGVMIGVVGERVFFNITSVDPQADIKESFIGDVGGGFLFELVVRLASQQLLLPKLNEMGSTSFELPTLEGVRFVNSQVIDHDTEDVFIVATDVIYEPTN